jgi:hypothetical protein
VPVNPFTVPDRSPEALVGIARRDELRQRRDEQRPAGGGVRLMGGVARLLVHVLARLLDSLEEGLLLLVELRIRERLRVEERSGAEPRVQGGHDVVDQPGRGRPAFRHAGQPLPRRIGQGVRQPLRDRALARGQGLEEALLEIPGEQQMGALVEHLRLLLVQSRGGDEIREVRFLLLLRRGHGRGGDVVAAADLRHPDVEVLPHAVRVEAERPEDGEPADERRRGVREPDEEGVVRDVRRARQEARVGDHDSEAERHGEEHLRVRLQPDLGLQQHREVGGQVEVQALDGAGQRDAADDEDEEQQPRQEDGQVDDLPHRLGALPDAQDDEDPRREEPGEHEGIAEPELERPRRQPENLAVEELVRVVAPGQGRRADAVVEAPGHDDRVVGRDDERDADGTPAEELELLVDLLERARRGALGLVPEAELEHEQGDADGEERDEVGDQERAPAELEADVGEPPDVPQPDRGADRGQDEGDAGIPLVASHAVPSPSCYGTHVERALEGTLLMRRPGSVNRPGASQGVFARPRRAVRVMRGE